MNQIEIKKRMEELSYIYKDVKIYLEEKFQEIVTCNGYTNGNARVLVGSNFDTVTFEQLDSVGNKIFATNIDVSYRENFHSDEKLLKREYIVNAGYTGSIKLEDVPYINRYRFLVWCYDHSENFIPIFKYGIDKLEKIRKEYNKLSSKLKDVNTK